MPGPAPKDPSVRARRNKSSTRSSLAGQARETPALPELDGVQWHPMTLMWWADVWSSPMSSEYLTADRHGLFRLAMLVEEFWRHPLKEIAAEIRLQEKRYGLNPLDRRALEWSVESAEDAKDRGAQRRGRDQKASPPAADPRRIYAVS